MNGRDLALGLVAGLAVVGIARRRGSPNVEAVLRRCDDGLYHVTRARLLPAIRAHGLVPSPSRIKPTFGYFSESGHLSGRLFVAAGVDAAAEWWMSIQMQRQDERRSAPLVLLRVQPERVKAYAEKIQHDTEGARDTHLCSFFLNALIAPNDLEVARPNPSFGRTMPQVMEQVWDARGGIRSWARPFYWSPLIPDGPNHQTGNA
jgi:hypothetical protein